MPYIKKLNVTNARALLRNPTERTVENLNDALESHYLSVASDAIKIIKTLPASDFFHHKIAVCNAVKSTHITVASKALNIITTQENWGTDPDYQNALIQAVKSQYLSIQDSALDSIDACINEHNNFASYQQGLQNLQKNLTGAMRRKIESILNTCSSLTSSNDQARIVLNNLFVAAISSTLQKHGSHVTFDAVIATVLEVVTGADKEGPILGPPNDYEKKLVTIRVDGGGYNWLKNKFNRLAQQPSSTFQIAQLTQEGRHYVAQLEHVF